MSLIFLVKTSVIVAEETEIISMLRSFRLCLDLVERRNVRNWLLSCAAAAALLCALCSV